MNAIIINDIDFILLRMQKRQLMNISARFEGLLTGAQWASLEGMLGLVDSIQDYAAKHGVATETEVFGPKDGDGFLDDNAEQKIIEAWREKNPTEAELMADVEKTGDELMHVSANDLLTLLRTNFPITVGNGTAMVGTGIVNKQHALIFSSNSEKLEIGSEVPVKDEPVNAQDMMIVIKNLEALAVVEKVVAEIRRRMESGTAGEENLESK